eukprot:GHVH01007122.1.p2 GENE.GHVH01007122.1~~GHVH01007122.1.p2  ORF type:complete len:182 (+),score=42.27 GHVH01007122.1:47-592(+)
MEPGKTYRTALAIVPRRFTLKYPLSWMKGDDMNEEENEENEALWAKKIQNDDIEEQEDEDISLANKSSLFGVIERELSVPEPPEKFALTAEQIDDIIDGDAMKVEETDNLVVCTSFLDGVSDLESHCLQCDNASIAVRSTNVMGNVTPLAIEWCGGFLLTEEPCNYVAVSSFETSDWGIEI